MTSIFDKAKELFQRVPVSPTNPQAAKVTPEFRIEDLYESDQPGSSPEKAGLDEKLRQAYFWITNTAIISPFYDIEYNEEPPRTFQLGDRKLEFTLPTGQSDHCRSARTPAASRHGESRKHVRDQNLVAKMACDAR
jgi:hypothetical protein